MSFFFFLGKKARWSVCVSHPISIVRTCLHPRNTGNNKDQGEKYGRSQYGRVVFCVVGLGETYECNIEIYHDTRPHTSIIIGFPSFMAFFKSPATPSKRQYKVRSLSYKVTKRNQWSDYSQVCPDKMSMTFAEQYTFSIIKYCIPLHTTLCRIQ